MGNRWFENPYLDDGIEKKFFERLKRSRSDYNKAQYLRIQASYLMNNSDTKQQNIGLKLMNEMLELFPNDSYNVMLAHSSLGRYYRLNNRYDEAIEHFEVILNHNRSEAKGKYDRPEMHIAKTIIESGITEHYGYARELMQEVNPRTLFIEREKQEYRSIMRELNIDND